MDYRKQVDGLPLVNKELHKDFLTFYGNVIDEIFKDLFEDWGSGVDYIIKMAVKHKFVGQLKKLDYVDDKQWAIVFAEELAVGMDDMIWNEAKDFNYRYGMMQDWIDHFVDAHDKTIDTLPRDMLKIYQTKVKEARKKFEKLNDEFEEALRSTAEEWLDPKLISDYDLYVEETLNELWNGWTYETEMGQRRAYEIGKFETKDGNPHEV